MLMSAAGRSGTHQNLRPSALEMEACGIESTVYLRTKTSLFIDPLGSDRNGWEKKLILSYLLNY